MSEPNNTRGAAGGPPIAAAPEVAVPPGPLIPDNPLFEGFQDKVYPDKLLDEIYSFSQMNSSTAYIRFSNTPNEDGKYPSIIVKGFRSIVPFLLIQYLDKKNIFVTPTLTILGESDRYTKSAQRPDEILNIIANNSLIGITNFDTYDAAFKAQTNRQAEYNSKVVYSTNQTEQINNIKNHRAEKYKQFKNSTNAVTRIIDSYNGPVGYPVANYYLFSETSRRYFINIIQSVKNAEGSKLDIIIIPLTYTPIQSSVMANHAQFILIHISREMYTIIDGQFDNSPAYRKIIIKELRGIDPLITECMGEQFQPYFYSVPCPQSVIVDSNCIWWSMLIMYLYIKSDPDTVDYQVLLKKLVNMSDKNPVFMFRLLSSFKAFVFESVILPRITAGTVVWPDMDIFLSKRFPEAGLKTNIVSGLLQDATLHKTMPLTNIHGNRTGTATAALQEAESKARDIRIATREREKRIRMGGPAVIGHPPKTLGGRRKKLTSTTRSKKRTHSRYGKHTRKSHRRYA